MCTSYYILAFIKPFLYVDSTGDLCGPRDIWFTGNGTISLASPGWEMYLNVPCSISCFWIVHASDTDYKIYVEVERFHLSFFDSFLIGNGDNPRDNASVFAGTQTQLSTGKGLGSSDSTIWLALETSSCEKSGGRGYFQFKLEQVNGSSKRNAF